MYRESLFDKTSAAKSINDIQTIAHVLLRHFKITFFEYIKVYQDHTHIAIATNADWLKCFYGNKTFFRHGVYQKSLNAYTNGWHLWSQLKDQLTTKLLQTDFHVDHGITFVKKQKGFCEFFAFGTSPENHDIINWYLNNLDILETFILFFKGQGQSLIQTIEKDRLILPTCNFANPNDILRSYYESDPGDYRQSFLKEMQLHLSSIKSSNNFEFQAKLNAQDSRNIKSVLKTPLNLSPRQAECVHYLLLGYSAKQTAAALNLSTRTIDFYLNNLRRKFGCRSKIALIAKLCEIEG